LITTSLSPKRLKRNVLRPIESELGRVRTYDKYAPRPIDLDIVIYAGELYDPALWIYAYLALPVAEVLPGYAQPQTGERLENLAIRISQHINTRKLDWIL
jgi:7,8-dihydro-6-hydroxymethylpterin-pyrophosphokinase